METADISAQSANVCAVPHLAQAYEHSSDNNEGHPSEGASESGITSSFQQLQRFVDKMGPSLHNVTCIKLQTEVLTLEPPSATSQTANPATTTCPHTVHYTHDYIDESSGDVDLPPTPPALSPC
ncbi:MAG: hypothetical protein WDW38_008566 [Sanguina aurantia]